MGTRMFFYGFFCFLFATQNGLVTGQRTGNRGFDPRGIRQYYIQAEKVTWDYLPSGMNMFDNDTIWEEILVNGQNRIGSVYSKYVYKRYTDATFRTEIPSPEYMGYVGPTLHAEVGEIIRIHFRNKVDIAVSLHPHGVLYDKASEGALYIDGTSGKDAVDDTVKPGSTVDLTWRITSEFAPADGDQPCIPFSYHSHRHAEMAVNSGLVGLVVVCKQGMLTSNGSRDDVNREVVLFVDSVDEGNSWLIEENLKRCRDQDLCKRLLQQEDPDFLESLAKDAINGYMFGNMPGLELCAGDKVAVYVFALQAELHPINILGQTFKVRHHRKSVVGIYPATFRALEMTAVNPGRWIIQCLNSEHNINGMRVFFTVKDCGKVKATEELGGRTRHYYLKTEVQPWSYAPSGENRFDQNGGNLTDVDSHSRLYYAKSIDGQPLIGGTYKKSRYVRYTDDTFTTPWTIPETEAHLGLLGPVIRAEVGDTIKIVIKNEALHPVSIYLPGTSFDASEIGMLLKKPGSPDEFVGHVIEPSDNGTYTFTVPWSLSPEDGDPPCVSHMYFSAANMQRDVSSGLVGPLVICKHGYLDPDTGRQRYVDREMFVYFTGVDENLSWHLDDNIDTYINTTVEKHDDVFRESNIMRSINGRAYGNLDGLDTCQGDTVAWHVLSFGDSEGLYGATFNGNNILVDGVYRDNHMTVSGLNFDGLMEATNIGNWSLWCHNTQHYDMGMKAVYHVDACGDVDYVNYGVSGVTRRYYIAAVMREWNHSPETIDPIDGHSYADPLSSQYGRVRTDCPFLGSTYTKALYREFTDETFTQEFPINKRTKHLGALGPFIRGNVGDAIEVVFKNMASRHFSIHAQQLLYDKPNEGMGYRDGEDPQPGNAVAPGANYTYRWRVPESAGPGPDGPNCVGSMYQSGVNPVKDMYSGLMGPIIICRRGILDADNVRTDSVEAEFALIFLAINENESWFIEHDIADKCPPEDDNSDEDPDPVHGWEESNMYDGINGLVYNNVRGLDVFYGDNVYWYVMGLGQSEDIHTAHFHGQSVTLRYRRPYIVDVVEVAPGMSETAVMVATNPGTWLLHCHVGEHAVDGMEATFTVTCPPHEESDDTDESSENENACIEINNIVNSANTQQVCFHIYFLLICVFMAVHHVFIV